jgi:hypothetical protein
VKDGIVDSIDNLGEVELSLSPSCGVVLLSLGPQILVGDKIENSDYVIKALKDEKCATLCEKTYTSCVRLVMFVADCCAHPARARARRQRSKWNASAVSLPTTIART